LGVTIDSLKYYFFLGLFQKFLRQAGLNVEAVINIADTASITNREVDDKEGLYSLRSQRVSFLEKIIRVYGLDIKAIFMSEFAEKVEYRQKLETVKNYSNSKTVKSLLEKTVLRNRLKQEKDSGYRYSLEEIALSLLFNIKIGPPREIYYDKAALIVSKKSEGDTFFGIYLTPTYPLGKNFAYFIIHPDIEQFGVTPYKAGSNKLEDFRIILGKTSIGKLEELINTSFISTNPALPNPVFDLYVISDLARKLLTKDYSLPVYSLSLLKNISFLKTETIENVIKYIYKPLSEGQI